MILVDSDVFLIDLRYPRDDRFEANRSFLDRMIRCSQGATTIFNLLEICGVLSFNLNRRQLADLQVHFARRYRIRVLPNADPHARMPSFPIGDILAIIERRVAFGDALVLALIEVWQREITALVTWNARHFRGRTDVEVQEPPIALMPSERSEPLSKSETK